MCDDEFDRQGGEGMRRSRRDDGDWDDRRPRDWDCEPDYRDERPRRYTAHPDYRDGQAVTEAPGPDDDLNGRPVREARGPRDDPSDDPRTNPTYRKQPGPDGAERPVYTGPRNTEQYLVREWQVAYEQACCEVRVEILKERIRKTWGKSIAKVAEELDKLMYKDWQFCQKKGDHSKEREKLLTAFAKTVLDSYKKGPK